MRMRTLVATFGVAALALTAAACGKDEPSAGGGNSGGNASDSCGELHKFTAASGVDVAGSQTFSKAKSRGNLIVGVKADQPNLGYKDANGKRCGFDIEVARMVSAGLGLDPEKIEYKEIPSANRETAIAGGEIDYYVGTYSITDKRKKQVSFAGPYFIAGQDLLVKADSTIIGPEGLDGKKVCSAQGSTPAKRIQTDHPKAKLQQFDSYSKCLPLLESGKVDAVTTDDIILAGYAAQSQYAGKFKVVGKPFSTEPYGIGLKKDDKDGCEKVNEILKTAASDGSYKAAWDATLGKSGKAAPELDTTKLTNCGSV